MLPPLLRPSNHLIALTLITGLVLVVAADDAIEYYTILYNH